MILLQRLQVSNFKLLRDISLNFPATGAILVEGRNESGKSTLFESIYFGLYGAGIVTEENKGSLESLISYGQELARVTLVLDVSGKTLCIERALRRGRSSAATLSIEAPGAASERITGVRAVNVRVIQELGGLDGSALLNSCFVEQKKLSKLEELDSRERRDSLLRILNLDKLAKLEDAYKVRAADETAVRTAEMRLRLATVSEELRGLESEVEARRRQAAHAEQAGRRAALQEAESAYKAATERVRWLEQLQGLDAAITAPATEESYEVLRDQLQIYRERRPRAMLLGIGGASALLLLGLVSFAAGVGWLGLLSFSLVVVTGLFTGFTMRQLGLRIADVESRLPEARARELKRRQRLHELRASLGVQEPSETAGALKRAYSSLGAAEQAVVQARGALQTLEESVSAARAGGVVGDTADGHGSLDGSEERLLRLRGEQRALADSMDVDAEGLDRGECEREHARAVGALETKRRATVILSEARRRIVGRVLPETERNMKLILPKLTAGRYHDARITESYTVNVWDGEAGRYVGKNMFSGGTQDGFSLALRLAFAIASLPQELGSSPGFLFMDEPLSAFDEERTRALVELVTRGELASIFPQICIISHSRSFDPSLFPYTIQMDAGRITYSNL